MEFSSVYLFTSWEFLLFLAVSLCGYYLVPKAVAAIGRTKALSKYPSLQNTQWIWLLLSSVLFYVSYYSFLSAKYEFGNFAYLFMLFLLVSILSVYGFALAISRLNIRQKALIKESGADKKLIKKQTKNKKQFLILLCCLLNIGILCVLKYTDFAVNNLNMLGAALTSPDWIILPLGISFYTFQSVGYLVDVYRGVCDAERNPFKFSLFVMYFPQIFQGPIGRYKNLAPQLFSAHKFDYEQTVRGVFRIAWGLFKKLVIADRIILYVNTVFGAQGEYSAPILVIATVMNALWLYADFSGYMDIALGASQAMGITLTENFEQPYFSLSVAEFWRRWHISLGDWFRDYLFYPILRSSWCQKLTKSVGKSKSGFSKYCSKHLGTTIGLIAVWLTMGFWHGASWKFVFLGVYFGAFIVISNLCDKPFRYTAEKLHGWFFDLLRMLRTFIIVAVGFIFFSADSFTHGIQIITRIVTLSMSGSISPFVSGFNSFQWAISAVALMTLLIVDIIRQRKGNICDLLYKKNFILRAVILMVLLLGVIVLGVYGSGDVSFAYFDF